MWISSSYLYGEVASVPPSPQEDRGGGRLLLRLVPISQGNEPQDALKTKAEIGKGTHKQVRLARCVLSDCTRRTVALLVLHSDTFLLLLASCAGWRLPRKRQTLDKIIGAPGKGGQNDSNEKRNVGPFRTPPFQTARRFYLSTTVRTGRSVSPAESRPLPDYAAVKGLALFNCPHRAARR